MTLQIHGTRDAEQIYHVQYQSTLAGIVLHDVNLETNFPWIPLELENFEDTKGVIRRCSGRVSRTFYTSDTHRVIVFSWDNTTLIKRRNSEIKKSLKITKG
jgi:hypothetical protein